VVIRHSSSHWGAIEAHVEDGRLTAVKPWRGAVPEVSAFEPPIVLAAAPRDSSA
jgi:hypothetical protein